MKDGQSQQKTKSQPLPTPVTKRSLYSPFKSPFPSSSSSPSSRLSNSPPLNSPDAPSARPHYQSLVSITPRSFPHPSALFKPPAFVSPSTKDGGRSKNDTVDLPQARRWAERGQGARKQRQLTVDCDEDGNREVKTLGEKWEEAGKCVLSFYSYYSTFLTPPSALQNTRRWTSRPLRLS